MKVFKSQLMHLIIGIHIQIKELNQIMLLKYHKELEEI